MVRAYVVLAFNSKGLFRPFWTIKAGLTRNKFVLDSSPRGSEILMLTCRLYYASNNSRAYSGKHAEAHAEGTSLDRVFQFRGSSFCPGDVDLSGMVRMTPWKLLYMSLHANLTATAQTLGRLSPRKSEGPFDQP